MLNKLLVTIAGCVLMAPCLPAQTVDFPGVTVDLGSAVVMHRPVVLYPQNLLAQRIQGAVTAQVTLDAKGNVADAQVLSGPVELRRTVLDSVLQWHFARGGASTRQVSVTFQPPASGGFGVIAVTGTTSAPISVAPGTNSQPLAIAFAPGVLGGVIGSAPAVASLPAANEPRRLARIQVSGFNEQLRSELLAALPVHEGDMVSRESVAAISAAARQYDEHLSVSIGWNGSGDATLQISAPGVVAASSGAAAPQVDWPGIRVGGNVATANALTRVPPVYPALARQARIQDHVILNAQIGVDGTVQNLAVVSGHPLLRQAALDAVRQWTFKPTLLNGQPVQVVTQLDINFTLPD